MSCLVPPSPPPPPPPLHFKDGVFDFMDTYEEKSLKVKIESHDVDLEKDKLEEQLQEVGNVKLY